MRELEERNSTIKRLRDQEGVGYYTLARMFGISKGQAYKIVNNRNYDGCDFLAQHGIDWRTNRAIELCEKCPYPECRLKDTEPDYRFRRMVAVYKHGKPKEAERQRA